MKVPGVRGVTLLASFHANETGVETLGCLFCVRELPDCLRPVNPATNQCGGGLSQLHESRLSCRTDVSHLEYGTSRTAEIDGTVTRADALTGLETRPTRDLRLLANRQ